MILIFLVLRFLRLPFLKFAYISPRLRPKLVKEPYAKLISDLISIRRTANLQPQLTWTFSL